MARQRRGGFRPPELRGTLGTLIQTTLHQAGVVRDVLERGAREGRSRLDEARTHRRRHDALAELGELVLDLIRRGEIDLGELPEARELVRHLDDLDDESRDEARDEARDRARDRPSRSRPRDDGRERDTDGTVSSKSPRPTPPSRNTASAVRVWRPPPDEVELVEPTVDEPPPPPRRTMPPNPHGKGGGIRFDSDDDLADYMHPDDVPPKPRPDGES